jgi:hypothetical protein
MRTGLVILMLFVAVVSAAAETVGKPTSSPPPGRALPLRGATAGNPCAAYGPGFVRIEGTGSCVKIGGAVDIGVAASSRR